MSPRLLTLLCASVAALALGVVASPAAASPSQRLLFDAPRDVFEARERPRAMAELESLGVQDLRVVMYWKDVAPNAESRSRPRVDLTDPASYNWAKYDGLMAAAREKGWPVVLTLTLPGPKWAMRGRKDFLTRPSPTLFGRFVEAAAKRYGDQVETWAIGNEPNHPDFLRPQYRGGKARSPMIYRRLFQAADRSLDRTGQARDTLLIGETLPRGRRGRSVAPLEFLRGMLCLDRRYRKRKRCARLDADGFAHHPYTTKVGPFFASPNRDDVTIGSLSRLTRALDRAARAGAIRRRMPIWLTEFGIQSTPDRFTGVSLRKQTEFRAHAERLAYGNSRVRAFSQYLLTDDPPIEGVAASQRYGGFESGLRFATGRPKPSLSGFKLPLAALRRGSRVSLWGLVRPAGGRTTVEILSQDKGSRRFRRLKTVRTDRRGYFTTRTRYRSGRRYRLRWQDQLGAPVRVLRRR
jgi:hypothetical protein